MAERAALGAGHWKGIHITYTPEGLMPFIRGELGKQYRRHRNKPQRSSWLSGQRSMPDAILAAAEAAWEVG